jgi:hypothetical protein
MPFNALARLAGTPASDHIYYNITISDDKTGTVSSSTGTIVEQPTQGSDIPLVFNQIRATPYLLRPEEYYLTVIRFTIETPSFPLFIPLVLAGQADVSKTVYSITLTYAGIPYKQPVYWIPQDETMPKPIGPVKQSDVSPANPYYYCYSYQHFADCINNSFKTATAAINLAHTKTYSAPYLQYDALTNLFTLGGNVDIYRTASNGALLGTVGIYFNAELYNLFASLPYIYTAGNAVVVSGNNLQMDYQLLLTTGTNVPTASPQPYITNIRRNTLYTTPINDVISVQEYQTLSLWCPVKSLIFKTNLLATAPEIMATPAVYEDGDYNINGAKQNADILNIMIDYVPQLDKGTEYKPYIFYQPNGEYKLTDLYGKTPVDAIDISVFWKDCFGNLIPFTLSASSSATIKILFRKKRFNSTKV